MVPRKEGRGGAKRIRSWLSTGRTAPFLYARGPTGPLAESERGTAWAEGCREQLQRNVRRGKPDEHKIAASFTVHPSRCSTLEHGCVTFAEGLREKDNIAPARRNFMCY